MTSKFIIKRNRYVDSVSLMSVTDSVKKADGIENCNASMVTAANREILEGLGFDIPADVGANDLVVAVIASDEAAADAALALEPGQVSGILEGAAGYLILRRLTTDEETLRSAHFDSLLRAAAADCVVQVSDAYEALQPGKFMAALGRNGGEAE